MNPTSTFGQHIRAIAELEAENARLQEQTSRMIDGGSCPRRDPNGECVELNDAISERDSYKALAERCGEALAEQGSKRGDGLWHILGCPARLFRPQKCAPRCQLARAALVATPELTNG